MAFIPNNPIQVNTTRTYDIYIPANPKVDILPAIIVFKGGGQNILTIESRWGMPNPPAWLADYIIVFPQTDPTLNDVWVHHRSGEPKFPEHDLAFVQTLINEITTTSFATGNATIPEVSADPQLLYGAGFSSGGAMVWQLANSLMVMQFKGMAAVGRSLDPEKAAFYRQHLAGQVPPEVPLPIPFIFIMGTADSGFTSPQTLREVPIDTTHPFFSVQEMIDRNGIPAGPAVTQLIPGSPNLTEVVAQLFPGGIEAFSYVTVLNGGHNWPTPATVGNPPVATHFNATQWIIEFWQNHAGLPG
jgi:poly(3-hydroxybutyrate) depolymerase